MLFQADEILSGMLAARFNMGCRQSSLPPQNTPTSAHESLLAER